MGVLDRNVSDVFGRGTQPHTNTLRIVGVLIPIYDMMGFWYHLSATDLPRFTPFVLLAVTTDYVNIRGAPRPRQVRCCPPSGTS